MGGRLALLGALHGLLGCRSEADGEAARDGMMPPPPIEEVLRKHTPDWMAVPGVVGTGIGLCEGVPCLKVFAAEPTPEIGQQIPASVEGYKVKVEITGSFRTRRPGQ